ncbi:DUF4286 family protein [Sphingobacterium corticibacter]|nr:DUF4286 family protein [Sphingobacterium corticibacter]
MYNISIIVEDSAQADALNWITSSYLPNLPVQHKPQLLNLLDSPHEGHTYSLQLKFDERDTLEDFKSEYLYQLQNYLATNHPERAFIFDSTMKYL